jgi:hypothetical protein
MKKFFNSLEEKFVFPIGRRTWQILALLSLAGLAAFIVWFLLNSTPTGRDSVRVSKDEVVNNRIDTAQTSEVTAQKEECARADYEDRLNRLKKDLPNAEWNNLGDSSDPYNNYLTDEYGNYVMDDYGNYVFVEKRDFRKNPKAMPNIIEAIFAERSIDSIEICKRIEILDCLHYLCTKTQKSYLENEGFAIYAEIIMKNSKINVELLSKSSDLKSKVDGVEMMINSREVIISFFKYVNYISEKNISDDQINICLNLLENHRKLSAPIFDRNRYFDLAEIVFECNIDVKELRSAVDAFCEDIEYYDKHDIDKSLNRYLNLFEEKLSLAELRKSEKEMDKASNRSLSLLAMGICFASVISIATILLLYSIQQLLRSHTKL